MTKPLFSVIMGKMKEKELKKAEELAEAALDFVDDEEDGFGHDLKKLARGFLYLYRETTLQKILRITDEG